MIDLGVQLLVPEARLPELQHPGDAGFDLRSAVALELAPGERAVVGTGIAIHLREGHAGLVVPRSGLAARHGISVVNGPGLIDSGYRGEIKVILLNTDAREPFRIEVGDRIAQLVVIEVPQLRIVEAAELAESTRGTAGFGSTGRV